MKILVIAATASELQPFLQSNQLTHGATAPYLNQELTTFITGVGILQSGLALSNYLSKNKFDLIIQIGISGTFDYRTALGSVVEVVSETLPTGAWDKLNKMEDVFDLELADPNAFPFVKKKLVSQHPFLATGLTAVNGLTVNQIETISERISHLQNKYQVQVESMEGAASFYVAAQLNIPIIQLRGISNYCGVRDKQRWKIKEALLGVTKCLTDYLVQLNEQ